MSEDVRNFGKDTAPGSRGADLGEADWDMKAHSYNLHAVARRRTAKMLQIKAGVVGSEN